jgi:protocatechuate 3,4-dioxygenase beta subunit
MIVVLLRSDGRPDVRPLQVIEGETVTADFGTPRGGARVAGRLLAADGAPLANQNLGLFERDSARWDEDWVASTTRADGSFQFEGVEPGRYLFYLIDTMGRGLRCVDELEVLPLVAEVEHDVRLSTGVLELAIVAESDGAPVPDAAVLLTRAEPSGGQTLMGFGASDATGAFAFRELGPGTYTAWAYPTHPELGFARSAPVVLDAEGRARAELELGPGGAADVVVRDPSGKPLEGAIVVFRDEHGDEHTFSRLPYTDARGRLRAQGLRPGVYQVTAQLAAHEGTPVTFRFDLGDAPEVPVVLSPVPR